jgi:hypothetical protein
LTSYPDIKADVLKRFQKRLRRQPANSLNLHHRLRAYVFFQNDLFLECGLKVFGLASYLPISEEKWGCGRLRRYRSGSL